MKIDYDLVRNYSQYLVKKENLFKTQTEQSKELEIEQRKERDNLEKIEREEREKLEKEQRERREKQEKDQKERREKQENEQRERREELEKEYNRIFNLLFGFFSKEAIKDRNPLENEEKETK